MPATRRIVFAAVIALSVGLSAIAVGQGLSPSFPIRLLQSAAIGVVAIVVLGVLVSLVMGRLADWREPASEAEFEEVVRRSERLARDGVAAEPGEIDRKSVV